MMQSSRSPKITCHGFFWKILMVLMAAALVGSMAMAGENPVQKPPETRKDNVKETLHGVEIIDPYRWLEDQEADETRKWIDAQNAYTHSFIDPVPGRDKLTKRLTELMKIDVIGIPTERNGRYFLSKRSKDQDLRVTYMRKGLDGKDEVLIDPHTMSEDLTTSASLMDISKDGTMVAYGVREGGEDEVTVKLMNVDTKKHLEDSFPKALYFGVSLAPDKSGLYYSLHKAEEGSTIYYHKMGTDPSQDKEIFGEGYGPEQGIAAGISEDGRYMIIIVFHGSAGQKTEVYFQNLETNGEITTIVNDIDARFDADIGGDTLYLLTNWEAPNGRIFSVDLNKPTRDNWKEIVPEGDGVMESFSLVGGKIFVDTLENVVSKVQVFEADGSPMPDISFDTLGTLGGMSGNWDSNEAFFVFTSFHVPTTIYQYDTDKRKKKIWSELDVPVDTSSIEAKQVWFKSKDGTKVPMFLVYSKGLKLDGNNPTLMTGYGGFSASMTPYFSSSAVLWVENGGVYAIPNLRGGGEFGEEWHKAGMFENKQNVFDDFIAAGEWLIENKYTQPSKLAISGGSNGGLLVGAAMVQRPELFGAVVCTYPLLDMIRYHNFMLAKFWVSEYGSADDPEQFKYIHAYSPYHNVKKGEKYPATLFITGDADTRVAPLHARKMAALLQSATGSDEPVLLLYDTKAGHSGGRPMSKVIEDEVDEFSFLFWKLGMTAPSTP